MGQFFRHDFFVQKWGDQTKYNIDKYPWGNSGASSCVGLSSQKLSFVER